MMKNRVKITALAMGIALTATAALAGCRNPDPETPDETLKQGTYRTYTLTLPSNWNSLTSKNSNDSQIMDYITSSFYEYDFKFDENKGGKFDDAGNINADAIAAGDYEVKYSAATKLEDVTASVDTKWGYTAEQKASGGYAYKITLRDDLTWDDGTPIHAADFVYSMQEQLNPAFMNYRASEYYGQVSIKNSRYYLYSTTRETYEPLSSKGYQSVQAAIESGAEIYIDVYEAWGMNGAQKVTSHDDTNFTYEVDKSVVMPQWVSIKDTTAYLDPALIKTYGKEDGTLDKEKMQADGAKISDYVCSAKDIFEYFRINAPQLIEIGGEYEKLLGVAVTNEHLGFPFEDVGIYAAGENELVVCLANPLKLLKEDGSLSYQAAYYMATLPLVKKDLYESCKQDPVLGSTLYTSNYNSSLATTASWGPYKLTQFQNDKSFTLERNDKWFGYQLEDNKNQYNVTKIQTELVKKTETQWMNFLSGATDDVSIDVAHRDDYRNSKYTTFTPSTGTVGVQLYGDIETLKGSGRNNGILAIKEFRKAVSLALNREEYNSKLSTANKACYGVLNDMYYHDVENGGVYRYTDAAKKALLRAYGFTENNGSWSNGGAIVNADLEEAYEAMTGYDLTQAKQLAQEAYQTLTASPNKYGYDATKPIKIKLGTEVDNDVTRRYYSYIQEVFATLTNGTPLEGKIEVEFDASFGSQWAEKFREGAYDMAFGTGFQNAPFNPGYMIGSHILPASTYHPYWDTETETLTLTMPAGEYDGAGATYTMPVLNWYRCLNAQALDTDRYRFNWGAGFAPETARLEIIAAIEEYILGNYYFIPTTAAFSASMLGAKFSNITNEYNTFMGFGGYRYMRVNYTDAEWTKFVNDHGKDLTNEYKKTAE